MYRTCPSCKNKIYFDVVVSSVIDPCDIIKDGNAKISMRCPCCETGVSVDIFLMTKEQMDIRELKEHEKYRTEILKPASSETEKNTVSLSFDKPDSIDFKKSCVCFTGKFANPEMTRDKLEKAAQYLGARISDSVSFEVTVLVVGSKSSNGWSGGNYGNKIAKAIDMKADKQNIEIISEEKFLELLKDQEKGESL